MSACREISEPFPLTATHAQWKSPNISSTWSRLMATDASVYLKRIKQRRSRFKIWWRKRLEVIRYLTPDSGSTWCSRLEASRTSALQVKWTERAWATRQWSCAGFVLNTKVSIGSFKKTGKADWLRSPEGRDVGSRSPPPPPEDESDEVDGDPPPENEDEEDVDVEEDWVGLASRSENKKEKKIVN